MNIASLLTHLAKANGNSFYHAIVLIKDKDKNSGRPSIPIAFEVNDGEVSFYERANIEDGISRAIQHHKAIHSVVLYEGERIVATIDDNYQVSLPKNSP